MLGYKLQLRSGLRINQRRTQAFAAAAAHPGKENFIVIFRYMEFAHVQIQKVVIGGQIQLGRVL